MRLLLGLLLLLWFTPAEAATQVTDITCETSTTTGTGQLTLAGAKDGGYLAFATTLTTGNTVPYTLVTGTGATRKLETGFGVFTSPSTLTRVATWSSDGSGAELNLAETSTVCVGPVASWFTTGAGSTLDADLLDGISSSAFTTDAEAALAYQPLDSDLTSWALITRAAGFDTFTTTPSMANLGSLLTDDAAGWTTFGTTPSMANLGTLLTDEASGWITFGTTATSANFASLVSNETGSGLVVFNTTPQLDSIEMNHATANTFTCSSGHCTIEGATVWDSGNDGASSGLDADLLDGSSSAAFQPVDADLTSWAGVTRASGFDTWVATPSMANLGSLLSDDAAGWTTFGTTPSSANLATLVTDDQFALSDVELGSIAGLTSAANRIPYFTGSGTAALFAFAPTDDNLDVVAGWDDSDGQYESLALAEIATEASPAAGDYVLIYGAEGDLRKSDWSTLPGGTDVTGKQTISLMAGSATIPPTGGCSPVDNFDSGSNDVFMRQCSFSASTDQAAYFTVDFPKSADESVDLTAEVTWTSATGTDATDDVIWTGSVVCFSNDDAINGNAFPTVDTATDTQTAAGDFLISPSITAMTPAGTWAELDQCVLRITRDADAGGDNFNGTAELLSVRLHYTNNAGTDD